MAKSIKDPGRAITHLATESLSTFSELVLPKYRATRWHQFLAKALEECYAKKIRRLCVSVPPRHGKSQLTSILFPAWLLTKQPEAEIIQAGYSSDLSEEFSVKTKAILNSERYLSYFEPRMAGDEGRAGYWRTTAGGSYYATSVGGGAVGRGADFFIIDDVFKNREQAESPTHRERIWNWFISTALTRLSPDGVLIIVMTRWHDDDLIGRLTDRKRVAEFNEAGMGDMNFKVIRLEAICENPDVDPLGRSVGQPLWPERWTAKRLAALKLTMTNYEWNAQYQQRPNPPGGNIVDTTKIKVIPRSKVPEGIEVVRGWDLAVSKTNLSDYSVGAQLCMDKAGNLYLIHIDRARRLWPQQKAVLFSYIQREAIGKRVGIEAVGAWETAASDIREHFKGQVIVQSYTPVKDKLTRALPWLAKIDGGMFFMVEGVWNQDFIDELEQFPHGAHDDQVDALTVGYEMIAKGGKLLFAF